MMQPYQSAIAQTRRQFLTSAAGGIGGLALASLLQDDGLLADEGRAKPTTGADRIHQPITSGLHFPAKAKSCIFIYLFGGLSQVDMFDPKPKLNELHGQRAPDSFMDKANFAFIHNDSAKIVGSPFKFQRHGKCGMELSEVLPHLGTCADDITLVRSMHTNHFNHTPAELVMSAGSNKFNHPTVGAWLNYGLGSESANLPGYVVLSAGVSSAGTSNWTNGFLPSNFRGVPFRNQGEPVLNLNAPHGFFDGTQSRTRDAIAALNRAHYNDVQAPEILAQTKSYELAFRMQSAVPELCDLSTESQKTLDAYGTERRSPSDLAGWGGGYRKTFAEFSQNCLRARRLVERGVRFVGLYHGSWDDHWRLEKNIRLGAEVVDQPIAALLKDLKRQGLLDSTLVVCASEFGRTPLGENRDGNPNVTGRDHHPYAFSMWLAGAGIKQGHVVGQTDDLGWNITDNPIHVHDLHATILHLFGIDHERLTARYQGRDVRLTDVSGRVATELLA